MCMSARRLPSSIPPFFDHGPWNSKPQQLAKGHTYLDVGDWNPSPGEHRFLGYSTDTTGYEASQEEGRNWAD